MFRYRRTAFAAVAAALVTAGVAAILLTQPENVVLTGASVRQVSLSSDLTSAEGVQVLEEPTSQAHWDPIECQTAVARANPATGTGLAYRNRSSFCAVNKYWVEHADSKGNVSWLDVRLTITGKTVGQTDDMNPARRVNLTNTRKAVLKVTVDITRSTGVFANPAASWLEIGAACEAPRPLASSCQSTTGVQHRTLSEWRDPSSRFAEFIFSSPAHSGEATVDGALGNARFTVRGGTTGAVAQGKKSDPIGIRFDSAGYLTSRSGAVFLYHAPFLVQSYRDASMYEVTRHIDRALNHPETTFPRPPAGQHKNIPGGSANAPLQRTIRDDGRHNDVQAACRDAERASGNNPDYTAAGMECDEFPFATTAQGPAHAGLNFSAYAVPARQNTNAGNYLNSFYNNDRVLRLPGTTLTIPIGDAFYVVITR
ncbi:NucA/NucB deoxyribonuclease domain-containing protein [Amycolatopsis pigmentata]|uniref:NucA/NucB deoxyribonuclease domain-containing protein n=1 Tax=Amycolatopsis pigmentata TaxID=450801 RepID=A0ABW5G4M3_9PSEU